MNHKERFNIDSFFCVLLFILAVFIANRDVSVGVDTPVYIHNFEKLVDCNCIDTKFFEVGFQTFTYIVTLITHDNVIYLFSIAFFLNILFYLVIKSLDSNLKLSNNGNEYVLLLFISFTFILSSNFFLTAGINGIRQGLSAPLIFLGAIQIFHKKYLLGLILLAGAVSFHLSSILYIACLPLLYLRPIINFYIGIIFSFLYATGATEIIVSFGSSSLGINLYSAVKTYSDSGLYEGFNSFFLLYSLSPFFHVLLNRILFKDFLFPRYIFSLYVALILPFLLLGFAGFANRYAFTAWLFLPLYFGVVLFGVSKKSNIVLVVSGIFFVIFFYIFVNKLFI